MSCERLINKLLEDLEKIDLELVDLALRNSLKEGENLIVVKS